MTAADFKHEKIHQSGIIPTAELRFEKAVRDACEANACGRFGKTWTCPPHVGTVAEMREKLLKFENAFVFTTVGRLEDSFDIEGMDKARIISKGVLKEAITYFSQRFEKILPLGCGSCDICKECTCPSSPCRFPEKAIVSVEACGINVVSLAGQMGINYHNGANTVTYFNMILF